ncbi:MAG: hypothetical protein PHQ14_10215 [Chromatiales bacterium]|jgi:N-formylglutamate deformylase|nr:hypothetical protein [Chromatiales bacterium]MDX9766784.1 hypothetical protein [Ectothiorhodospiraceae bacterium]
MHDLSTMSDDEFLDAFLACSLPPEGFDHRSHLRIAWVHLQRHALEDAIERTCDGIARFAEHLGAPDKYHRTLSEALMRLMAHGGAADPGLSWTAFLAGNPALRDDAAGLLAQYYSPERLALAQARRRFLDPDRRPLPR